ncbi:MAG: 50S ribosomal protein L29 [Candidatus Kerfeldbacteria bacterium RIFCSPLOWO2_01_FULL_48_11]|uniref:Large ribosomal subunit protein uL29 n=1 Tax=Candidatus Kerfeldbacteria bacterium RIFCSPLOWO2_01_FULL_48_11 TaxID=1798543 RepID=A0A1G2B827_9BACT|nr:MAG: hypothetical protein UY34_C0038G0011 [Parcubacteria group bacterium GW2011_GWA2_48_9]OGY84377.1 MAG: 50S ribosomal protein L29 [Candidatus Kerfeldbacteria bacterium RIFCSPLOWO2_01_FULL_48_11]HCJ52197.1 50S ribosomal protein L29 [Candidatus Kerfeldbacteria bacterium]HCM68519.1 50S ribosomal protein L29 [Candidatus Kerfeldbacteria bacterium]
MAPSESHVKSLKELHRTLSQQREKLRDARFRVASKQLKDVRSIRKLRMQIAQTLTTLNATRTTHHKP